MPQKIYTLSDFNFDLPEPLIAQTPLARRSASRLLQVDGFNLHDRHFEDLIEQLGAGDVLVFNDTRVIKARLFGIKSTGGRVEVLVERILHNTSEQRTVLAQIRASKSPALGSTIRLAEAFDVEIVERVGEFYQLQFPGDVFELLEQYGALPLPPYIAHTADAFDENRYQTVYSRVPGAVAAPTAGLHFDETLLQRCRDKGVQLAYVTLHVGAGTFQPVRHEDLSLHDMHTEWYSVPQVTVDAIAAAQQAGRDIIGVGTTSLRALESASQSGQLVAGSANTRLFITPGYRFYTVTRLVTNFHLPKSTLLMLVSAFSGVDEIRHAYAYAIEHQYRFFSYGDAMLLTNQANKGV